MIRNDGRLAQLERQIAELSNLITKIGAYALTDPDVCLNQARKTAEGVCWCVFSEKVGTPQRLELDVYIRHLEKAGAMPLKVIASLRTIQGFGNLGSHFQVNVEPLSFDDIAPCLAALASVTTWFFEEHLKIPPPARVSLVPPTRAPTVLPHTKANAGSSSPPASVRKPPARMAPNADRTAREKRLAAYEKAVAAAPTDSEALYARGCCLRELGRFDDALRDAGTMLALRSDDVGALRLRSATHHAMGRLKEAVDDAAAVLRADPADEFAMRISADANRKLGNIDAALADVDRILALHPNNAFGLCTRADAYRSAKRFDEAISAATTLLDIDPANQWALGIRGESRLELAQHAGAAEDATAILNDHPKSTYALNLRARARRSLGDFDGALVDGRRAIELRRETSTPEDAPVARPRDSERSVAPAAFTATLERAIAGSKEARALVELVAHSFGMRAEYAAAESLSDAFWLPAHWRGWYLQNRCKTEFDLHLVLTAPHRFVGASVEPVNKSWGATVAGKGDLLHARIEGVLTPDGDGGTITWRKAYLALQDQPPLRYTATMPSFDQLVGEWNPTTVVAVAGVFSAARAKGLAPLRIIDMDKDAALVSVERAPATPTLDGSWVGVLRTRRETSLIVVHLVKTSISRAEANIVRSVDGAIVLTHAEGSEDEEGVLSLRETRVVARGASGAEPPADATAGSELVPLALRLLPGDVQGSLLGTQEMGARAGSVELHRAR